MEMSRLKKIRKWLIGAQGIVGMESRIFHYVCVFSILALTINIPINHFIGVPELTVIIIVVDILIFISYYLSRWKDLNTIGVALFGLVTNLFFVLNFIFSSGTHGGALLYFLLSFFLTMSVMPKKQSAFWITLNLILVVGMLLVEYNYPYLINYQFNDEPTRYFDLSTTYLLVMIMITYITLEIRKSYYREKKAAEEKAQELVKINEEKNKLFSVVAHDLKSPMSSIQNYLELLEAVPFNETEKKQMEQDLLNNTLRVNEMIDNLLTWVRSQLDGVKPDLKQLNVYEVLDGTLKLSKLLAQKKNIRLDIAIEKNVFVIADAGMLQLIVRNLISNALKFTKTDGMITIRALNKDNICEIEVADNGVGIIDQDKAELFTPKLKSRTGTLNEKGSALGLLICRDYVVMQSGKIRVESKEGSGTSFFITFPV